MSLGVGRDEATEEQGYIDGLARDHATEPCVRCSAGRRWTTAALIYRGLEWEWYYCYDCQRWFKRHFSLRYAVAPVDDRETIRALTGHLEWDRDVLESGLRANSWVKRLFQGLLKSVPKN